MHNHPRDDGDPHDLTPFIREIDDWPEPGVGFKDITPLLADPRAFATAIDRLADHFIGQGITSVVGIEARGFVVAAPVAHRLGAGFVPVRKPGKLPWSTEIEEYELEYGTDRLEIHRDAVAPDARVVVIDDVIATGGTAAAAVRLVEAIGGEVMGLGFVVELAFLGGAALLDGKEHVSLIRYD
jgi:adenine phosphoribosyltransferase